MDRTDGETLVGMIQDLSEFNQQQRAQAQVNLEEAQSELEEYRDVSLADIPHSALRAKMFKDLCTPLVDYLYKFGTPHDKIIISQASAEHVSGLCAMEFELRD